MDSSVGKKPAAKKPKKIYSYIDLPIEEQTHSLTKREVDWAFEKEVSKSEQLGVPV